MQSMKKRALCVSDNEDTCEILAALLERRGYDVVCAPSYITALLVAVGQTFNLYVLDAQLQHSRGTELCRSIRSIDPLAPVILFSAAAAVSARLEAQHAGVTSYVIKPDIRGLIEAVNLAAPDALPGERAASTTPQGLSLRQ